MKRSALTRGKRLRTRRAEPRRSSYFKDSAYLDFLRYGRLGCQPATELGEYREGCSPTIDPDHRRRGVGMGQRAPDPLAHGACRLHHAHQHGMTGPYKGWSRERIDALIDVLIDKAQAAYYGRALTDEDLPIVRAAVAAGRPTRDLFASTDERLPAPHRRA